jgi:hypothetical protein
VYAVSTRSDSPRFDRAKLNELLIDGGRGWQVTETEDQFEWSFTAAQTSLGANVTLTLEQSSDDLDPPVPGRARGNLILEVTPALPGDRFRTGALVLGSFGGAMWISIVVARWCEERFPNLVGLVVFATFLVAWVALLIGGGAALELAAQALAERIGDKRRIGERLESIEKELRGRHGWSIEHVEPLKDGAT